MKRGILFFGFILFFVSFVSAEICSTDDDIILRLSTSTNAHGEVWNGARSYTTEICYSSIFGSVYSGTNPHTCTNSNKILGLNFATNAHAQIPENTNYGTNVCYGNLACQSVAGNVACPTGKTEVVSLSGSTNAHLENAGANIYSGANARKICCSSTNTLPPPIALTATINSPVSRGVYFANVPVDFVGVCSGGNGVLTPSWELIQNGISTPNTALIFSHIFTGVGQTDVKFTCTDSSGISATNRLQILVVTDSSVFAYINDPTFNGIEYNIPPNSPSSQPYFPRMVSFSASDSFAIEIANCGVTCLGGDCPSTTQNSPTACGTGQINIGGLSTPPNYNSLNFDWTFWDNDWTENWATIEGNGIVNGFLEYNDMSNSINDKHMSVLILATIGDNFVSANFQRNFTLGRCLNGGNTLLTSNGQQTSTNSLNVCKGADNRPNTGDECCPSGQSCELSTNNVDYSCQFLPVTITRCEDFTTKNSCDGNNNPSYPLASYDSQQPSCSVLRCQWTDSTNLCGVRLIQYAPGSNGCNPSPTQCAINDCAWTTTQTECLNGQRTINYNSQNVSSSNLCSGSSNICVMNPVTVPCGALNFELDFFGYTQFIITALVIAFLYSIFGIKNAK